MFNAIIGALSVILILLAISMAFIPTIMFNYVIPKEKEIIQDAQTIRHNYGNDRQD
jgi:hypothetical protein